MCLLYCVLRKNANIARASGRGSRGSEFTTCLVTLCAHVGHHQLQHFSDALSLPALPNCFVLERKHKGIKAIGDVTVTGSTWDKSVLRETTVHHLFALERNTFSKEAAVEDSHPPSRALKKSLGEWFGPHRRRVLDWSSCQDIRVGESLHWRRRSLQYAEWASQSRANYPSR